MSSQNGLLQLAQQLHQAAAQGGQGMFDAAADHFHHPGPALRRVIATYTTTYHALNQGVQSSLDAVSDQFGGDQ